MGDAPGGLRWMLVVLALLAAATWIMLGVVSDLRVTRAWRVG